MADIERRFNAFSIDSVIPLRDKFYYIFLKESIESAKYRIWVSMFIINITHEYDPQQKVRDLLKLLIYKNRLGVDVRVIVGDSKDVNEIKEADEITKRYLLANNIKVKKYKGTKKSTHSKYVIIDDDLIILGSHNWTNNAFGKSEEDSIAIYSHNLNSEMQYQFLSTWVD